MKAFNVLLTKELTAFIKRFTNVSLWDMKLKDLRNWIDPTFLTLGMGWWFQNFLISWNFRIKIKIWPMNDCKRHLHHPSVFMVCLENMQFIRQAEMESGCSSILKIAWDSLNQSCPIEI